MIDLSKVQTMSQHPRPSPGPATLGDVGFLQRRPAARAFASCSLFSAEATSDGETPARFAAASAGSSLDTSAA